MKIDSNFMNEFFDTLASEALYNETSFQFELGNYIKNKYPEYIVEYERNIKNKNIELDSNITKQMSENKHSILLNNGKRFKKEIDIFIYKKDLSEKYAIELKFPASKSGYTKAINEFEEDIEFVNFIKQNCKNFTDTYCINISRHKYLYSGNKLDITTKRNDITWNVIPNCEILEITDNKNEVEPKYYIYKSK